MQSKRDLIFIPKISTRPNKIVLFNEVSWYGKNDKPSEKSRSVSSSPKVSKQFHNFKISSAAHKNIQEKITWLYTLGKSRYVKTYSGKEIFNFKINFLTLTLPSSQVHNTATITNDLFNQFLTEIRQRTRMENYVWRLEFQGNGNVHYHIVTDTFIDYFFARKIWNRILNKFAYIDNFAEKMNGLSLNEYFQKYGQDKHENFTKIAKAYAKGVAEKWRNPPTVDVKVCTSQNAISNYISKYFSKNDDAKCICNPLDNEQNSFSLRLWFCSRSLSKLKSIIEFQEAANFRPDVLIKFAEKVKTYIHKYAVCYYFELRQMSNYVKSVLYPYFHEYAKSVDYLPAYSQNHDPT